MDLLFCGDFGAGNVDLIGRDEEKNDQKRINNRDKNILPYMDKDFMVSASFSCQWVFCCCSDWVWLSQMMSGQAVN